MSRPLPSNEGPTEVRRENQVVLDISMTQEPDKAISLGPHIRLLSITTEGHSLIPLLPAGLVLVLEVHGATTGIAFVSACHKCSTKVPSTPPDTSLFIFAAKDSLVGITSGKARVAFRFRCLPFHHGTTDREYR